MKINFTMWTVGRSGGNRVIFELSNRLATKGHDVTITAIKVPYSGAAYPCKTRINYARGGFPLFTINYVMWKARLNHSIAFYASIESLIEVLSKSIPKCDINIATFSFTAFAVHRSRKGFPLYYMQHYEPLFFGDHYFVRKIQESYYLPMKKIVNSVWLKKVLGRKTGLDIPVVPVGVDTNVFYPRNVQRPKKKRILCLSHDSWIKGFSYAVDAMRIVQQQLNNVEFVTFGPTPPRHLGIQYEYLRNMDDNDLAKLYSSSDMLICPSLYESPGLPPLEAMACGTPIVVTKYVGNDYVVNMENALVTPPKDSKAMANAIMELLYDQSLAQKLRKRGLETARKFTWNRTVEKFEQVLQDSLKKEEWQSVSFI
jgi:glycosyltransferase involved in cell wall biosynthesis